MESKQSEERLFLVEGKTDEIIVREVLRKLQISDVSFAGGEGIDKLLAELTAFIKRSNAMSIGIIVDANKNLEKRWESIRNRLNRSDLEIELPDAPSRHGVIQKLENQNFGVWVMPNNQDNGMLEDFVKEMIPDDDAWRLAVDYIERAKDSGLQIKESKSLVYAWLAIIDPGRYLGTAFGAGKFKFDTANYKNFENWIRDLCR